MNPFYILDNYWDMLLPVKTDSLANYLGFFVKPINLEKFPNKTLIVSIEEGKGYIGYNKNNSPKEIRKNIAIGIAKHINKRITKDVLAYNKKELLDYSSDLNHFIDFKFAWELLLPSKAVKIMVLNAGYTNIQELSYHFDVSKDDMVKRLKEVGLL